MFQYHKDGLASLASEALVVDVDCVGRTPSESLSQVGQRYPDVLEAFRGAFEAGDVEPARVLHHRRRGDGPAHIFFVPSRVHPQGEVRQWWIESAARELTEQVLRFGIRSVAVPQIEPSRGMDWPEVKLRWLCSFARVPDVQLFLLPSAARLQSIKQVAIFADGGAEANHRTGGYGVVLRFGDHCRELSEGFRWTNSERMELHAAIAGLETLKRPCHVRLHSDSKYVVDAVNTGMLFRMAAKDWVCRKKNLDLWRRFLATYLQHEVEMVWVKGHSGIDDNERCDRLASEAMGRSELQDDPGYTAKTPSTSNAVAAAALGTTATKAKAKRGPKVKREGDPCRHCGTPLVRRRPTQTNPKSDQYYLWYLYCQSCRRIYHVEDAKVHRNPLRPR